METLPTEIILEIALFSKDAKAVIGLLLFFKDLGEYLFKFPVYKEMLKKSVCKLVFSGKKQYYCLPNGKKHGICQTTETGIDGILFTKSFYKDGKREGEYKSLYKNKKPCEQYSFVNDKREGEYKNWFKSGQLLQQYFYKNDMKEGEYKSWFSNGQLREQYFYKDGAKEGEYKTWFSNGQIYEHYFLGSNEKEGEYKSWFQNGQLHVHRFYKGGRVTQEISFKIFPDL